MTKPFLRLAPVVIGAVALFALPAKEIRATSVQIDLGPTGVLSGANPETNNIPFNGLNGTPVVGSISVDLLFTNNDLRPRPRFAACVARSSASRSYAHERQRI